MVKLIGGIMLMKLYIDYFYAIVEISSRQEIDSPINIHVDTLSVSKLAWSFI